MSLKFCANLAFMFTEMPTILERYGAAKAAGFKAVEGAFPEGFTVAQVVEAKNQTNIEQILINNHVEPGQFGSAAIPGKEETFKKSLNLTIELAKAINCKKIHVTAGKIEGCSTKAHDETYEKNLRYAAKLFEENGLIGLIEPINKYSVPNYYLNNYEKALQIIKAINSPNLKLQLDLFHLQHIKGDLTNNIKALLPFTGHIQIAQVPHRGEPNTPGEINYNYIFSLLINEGYSDWIGLEYKPAQNSVKGLTWITDMGFQL